MFRRDAMTLIELLMVTVIIGVLAALFLPAIEKARNRSRQSKCISNLRQIGVASHVFANEHQGRWPTQLPANEGGTMGLRPDTEETPEFSLLYRPFQVMSNQLGDTRLLICPSDRSRTSADHFGVLRLRNVSYAFSPSATPLDATSSVAWDRPPDEGYDGATQTLITGGFCYPCRFLHDGQCDFLYGDGRVERLTLKQFSEALAAKSGTAPFVLAGVPSAPGSTGTSANSRVGSGASSTQGRGAGTSASSPSGGAVAGASAGNSALGLLEQTFGAKAEPLSQNQSANRSGSKAQGAQRSAIPVAAVSAPEITPVATNQSSSTTADVPVADVLEETNELSEAEVVARSDALLGLAKSGNCSLCWILPTLLAVFVGVFLAWILERRRQRQPTTSRPLSKVD